MDQIKSEKSDAFIVYVGLSKSLDFFHCDSSSVLKVAQLMKEKGGPHLKSCMDRKSGSVFFFLSLEFRISA